MAEADSNDLFVYFNEQCHISSSQEEILHCSPFVGEIVNSPHHEASPSSGRIPVASTGIITTSLTAETPLNAAKDSGPQDVFHTSPEQSSLPTSQQREYAEAIELVNLSDDSELGLAQVRLKQRVGRECSRGLDGVDAYIISESEFDEYLLWKGQVSSKDGLGESSREKVKISEQNPSCEKNKLVNEVAETCEGQKKCDTDKRPELGVHPSSIRECMEKKAKDKKEGKGNSFDYTVLKALVYKSEGESVDNVSWLQLAKARGIHFPRPRWKKEKDDGKN